MLIEGIETELPKEDIEALYELQDRLLELCKRRSHGFDTLIRNNVSHHMNVKTIRRLDISVGCMKELPVGIFDKFTNLERLECSSPSFKTLEPGIFDKLSKLKCIEMNSGKLEYIPVGVFGKLKDLERLVIDENNLRTLPSDLFTLPNLIHIEARYNRISSEAQTELSSSRNDLFNFSNQEDRNKCLEELRSRNKINE
ncbi:MAG: hypothetical protein ACXAD7_21560 [Candidatus Kariarchaeaceae archaeon]|jgi:Leucine-rich repeat (LRR) protein